MGDAAADQWLKTVLRVATLGDISQYSSMNERTSARSGFPCPHCGEFVAAGARRCRECGASDEYGWNHDQLEQNDCGDDDFDYDDYVAREFPGHADPDSPALMRRDWIVWIIGLLIAALLMSTIWW